jgi:hypothetical protein
MDGQADPGPFTLERDAWGRLVLTDAGGRRHAGVVPVRAFPFTAPCEGLSLCDAGGREVVWVPGLDALPEGFRREIEEELARREFAPVIRRVLRVSPRVEPSEWDVETDRGRTRFVLNSPDDVRRLDEGRAMLVDAHGVRYLIADLAGLDPASRRTLERYL